MLNKQNKTKNIDWKNLKLREWVKWIPQKIDSNLANVTLHFCTLNKYTVAETIYLLKENTQYNFDSKYIENTLNLFKARYTKGTEEFEGVTTEQRIKACESTYKVDALKLAKELKKVIKNGEARFLNDHLNVTKKLSNKPIKVTNDVMYKHLRPTLLDGTKKGLCTTEILAQVYLACNVLTTSPRISRAQIHTLRLKAIEEWKKAGYNMIIPKMSNTQIEEANVVCPHAFSDLLKNVKLLKPVKVETPLKTLPVIDKEKSTLFNTKPQPKVRTEEQRKATTERIKLLENRLQKEKDDSQVLKQTIHKLESQLNTTKQVIKEKNEFILVIQQEQKDKPKENTTQKVINIEALLTVENYTPAEKRDLNTYIIRFKELSGAKTISELNQENKKLLVKYVIEKLNTENFSLIHLDYYIKVSNFK